jgi:2-methylcitrate dehydratase PrpD
MRGGDPADRKAEPVTELTERLARLATEWVHPDQGAALDLAERAVVDTVAVSLAGATDRTVTTMLGALGDELGAGSSTVLVTGQRTDPRQAALIGGLSAHALDFDDVDDAMIGHPSAVLVPAVLAVGEQAGSSGREVLEAYWVGLAACRTVAAELGIDGHYAAGWHATATIGTLAAAAATARLRGLRAEQVRHALGIAGSLASGSRQNFGTMTKPLHAGTAASNGVLAATLAAGGFTADTHQLEAPLGFLAMHHGSPGTMPAPSEDLEVAALNVKLYPCCYYIHASADAMIDLAEAGLAPRDVESVHVTVQPAGLGALIHHRPVTGLQGKFSMEYAMAAALVDRRLSLQTFTDEMVRRPQVQDLLRKVSAETSPHPPVGPAQWQGSYAVVSVRTVDGRTVEQRVDHARGHATRPVSEEELRGKFDDCLPFGGLRPSDELYAAWRHLRELSSVRDATGLLATAAPASVAGAAV